MKDKKNIEKLYNKFTDNSISREELKVLLEHLHQSDDEALVPLKKLLRERSLEKATAGNSIDRDKFRKRLKTRIDKEVRELTTPVNMSVEKNYVPYRVAAVVALALLSSLSIYFLGYRSTAEVEWQVHQTESRQKSTITLPDGTVIRLNSGSRLTYPNNFEENIREVLLEGEAFFDVVRDEKRPFLVRTGKLTTTVLGTSFNIRAYPDDNGVEVAVATGRVSVSSTEGELISDKTLVLNPNEVANFDSINGSLTKTTIDVSDLIAWKDGVLVLNDTNFAKAGRILEKWFGMKVIFGNQQIKSCLIRGTFKDPSLQQVLEALKFSHNIEYEFRADTVTVRGEGCD